MLISRHEDRVFVECDCGCSIISFNRLDENEVYLEYFGGQKIKDAGFIFSDDDTHKGVFNTFIELLTRACNFIFTERECEEFREVELGYVENKKDGEALSIHVDTTGIVTINKYRKNAKKFLESHDQKFILTGFRDSVPYKKCKCDWELLIGRTQALELRNRLLTL